MQKIIPHITLGSVFLSAMFLPLSTAFSNIALGVLLASTLLSFFVLGINLSIFSKPNFYFYSPLLFFLIIILGTLYSPFNYETLKEVKRMLFMLVLPAVALRKDLKSLQIMSRAAGGLLLGAIGSAVILLLFNTINIVSSQTFGWYSIFSYHHTSFSFTAPLHLHPIYLGSYYVMALVFIFNKTIKLKKWVAVIIPVILYTGILFLNSRIIYGMTALISLLFLFKSISWKSGILILGVLLVGVLFAFSQLKNTYVVDKLISGTKWELSDNVGTYNTDHKHQADSRLSRWKVAWELVQERPIIGSGTGTERGLLAQKFKDYQMVVSYESRYNAHNQFLGFLIRFGIIGLLLFMIYFIGNGITALRHSDLTFLCFLILLFGVCLVENYLDRNMGIAFVSFFGTLFYIKSAE